MPEEAAPLPPQDGVGGNDHEGLPPPGPDSSQPDPEEAIRHAKLGSGRRSFVHSQLLPQGKVFDSELAVAAEEEREESKHVEQEGDHRAKILSGSAPIDQRPAAGRGFGEGQGPNTPSSTYRSTCSVLMWNTTKVGLHLVAKWTRPPSGSMCTYPGSVALAIIGMSFLTVDVAALHLSRSPRDARANRHGLTLARPSGLSRCKSDPVSLDVVWTTMTAAKEAEHERQGAEAHHDTWQ